MIHSYKLGGYNIILDINSGSIHSVDAIAFDAIIMLETQEKSIVSAMLISKYPELTEKDVAELIEEIETLKNCGKLYSPDTYAPQGKKQISPLKALCVNIAHVCNMRCTYCFAGRGEYGGDEGIMSLEVGKQAIDFLIAHSDKRKNLDIDFFGGEPLLGWQVIKDIVVYAREVEKKHDKKFRFTLTTNGLLLDDEVIEFANNQMHNVVLSLDGRPEINDMHRLMPDGSGSYDKVLKSFEKIVEARQGKNYYIRGTYTKLNKDFINDILHIADLGFKEISLEPAVTKPASPLGFTDEDLPELYKQYETLAIEMLKRTKEEKAFSFYHFNLDLSGGPCVHKRIAGCGVGTEYMAVTPSGKLYPCHQFIGDEQFVLGDVRQGITNKKLREQFNEPDIYSRKECRDCWARFYCSGGCAANAFNDTGDVAGIYKLGCDIFKKRLECAIMMKIAML